MKWTGNNLQPKKRWLTIVVINEKDKSFTIKKNISFNIADYEDVLTVLSEIFRANILTNRKDKIQKVEYLYRFESKEKEDEIWIKNITLWILVNLFF